jgi:hypothetical protein
LRFVLMRYAVGVGVPLEVDEEVVEDAVVLEGWLVVFVSVVAVVPVAWFVSVFVAVSAVVGAGVVASPPVPPPPPPAAPPPAAPPAPSLSEEVDVVEIVESVVVPEALAVGVIVVSEPETLAIVPVTEAVTVDATVVLEIVPAPVWRLAHSTSRVQKLPPQVKLSVPQQSKGTLKISPVESVSIPGLASTRHVALRKSSVATWLSEVALIEMSCPRVKPRSSTAAAARKKWGIEACIESCRSK